MEWYWIGLVIYGFAGATLLKALSSANKADKARQQAQWRERLKESEER
jgi:hypothetical protein